MKRRRITGRFPRLVSLRVAWKLTAAQSQACEYGFLMGIDALRRQWAPVIVGRYGRRIRPMPDTITTAIARRSA